MPRAAGADVEVAGGTGVGVGADFAEDDGVGFEAFEAGEGGDGDGVRVGGAVDRRVAGLEADEGDGDPVPPFQTALLSRLKGVRTRVRAAGIFASWRSRWRALATPRIISLSFRQVISSGASPSGAEGWRFGAGAASPAPSGPRSSQARAAIRRVLRQFQGRS